MTAGAKAPFRALVADYGDFDASAEVPGVLAGAGASVDIYCSERSWLRAGGKTRRWVRADTSDPDAYVRGLVGLAESGEYDWIVLADDPAIRIVNDRVSDPECAARILPIVRGANRAFLGSKAGLVRLCVEHDIRSPEQCVMHIDGTVEGTVPAFPLLAKRDRSEGGSGVFLCADQAALDALRSGMSDEERRDLVLQRYVSGDNISVEALYRNGELLAAAVSRVLRTFPNEFGTSIDRLYGEPHAVEDLLVAAGRAAGANGFANITIMRDRETGEYLLVELDMRPNCWFRMASRAGVDFSRAARMWLEGRTDRLIPPPLRPVTARYFMRDMLDALGRKDFAGMAKWAVNADGRWRWLPTHDRKLMRTLIGRACRHIGKRTYRVLLRGVSS